MLLRRLAGIHTQPLQRSTNLLQRPLRRRSIHTLPTYARVQRISIGCHRNSIGVARNPRSNHSTCSFRDRGLHTSRSTFRIGLADGDIERGRRGVLGAHGGEGIAVRGERRDAGSYRRRLRRVDFDVRRQASTALGCRGLCGTCG